jgi:glutamate racemase
MRAAPARVSPIGVFDSGVGGLSVLRALRASQPRADFIYLGDTARLPYGTKTAQSVVRYSLQCAATLVARNIRCLVVACNTASAYSLPALRAQHPDLPVIGVIEPGARAAVAASTAQCIAVIGTEATIQGGAYQAAIQQLNPRAEVRSLACSLFVALAEEGWTSGPIPEVIARRYLDALFDADGDARPDTLVLGCTHFPALIEPIRAVLPAGVRIVDSAGTTAGAVLALLPDVGADDTPGGGPSGHISFLATDGAARFARVGSRFLGEALDPQAIEIVDLSQPGA